MCHLNPLLWHCPLTSLLLSLSLLPFLSLPSITCLPIPTSPHPSPPFPSLTALPIDLSPIVPLSPLPSLHYFPSPSYLLSPSPTPPLPSPPLLRRKTMPHNLQLQSCQVPRNSPLLLSSMAFTRDRGGNPRSQRCQTQRSYNTYVSDFFLAY